MGNNTLHRSPGHSSSGARKQHTPQPMPLDPARLPRKLQQKALPLVSQTMLHHVSSTTQARSCWQNQLEHYGMSCSAHLHQNQKPQCFVKTIRDKCCPFPLLLGYSTNKSSTPGKTETQRGTSALFDLLTGNKAPERKTYCPNAYYEFPLPALLWLFITNHSISLIFDKFLCWFLERLP